jgi:hypothetical protein
VRLITRGIVMIGGENVGSIDRLVPKAFNR